MHPLRHLIAPLMAASLALGMNTAFAATGKLLLTGGVSSVDGAAGGGITPWALVGSNATEGEVGVSAFPTHSRKRDYGLDVPGLKARIAGDAVLDSDRWTPQNRMLALLAPMHRDIIAR